jgi:quaternary ammonium compound-resistance protein SugE
MPWLYILFADAFEVAWPFALKYLTSYSKWAPLFVSAFSIPMMFLLAESVKQLPAATVYATFVGVGTAGTAIIGMIFFHESTSFGRLCSLLLVLAGVVGLRLFSGTAE